MGFPPDDYTGGAVTIGNFDGVHQGHQALIAAAIKHAKKLSGPATVVTFDPPPLNLLNPSAAKPPLMTSDDRVNAILACGADRVITLETNPGLLSLSPEAFFEDVICFQLKTKALIEGVDFRFGRGRVGDVNLLKKFCKEGVRDGVRGALSFQNIAFEAVPQIQVGNEVVSSSRIRNLLVNGDTRTASKLLTRPYKIQGTVVAGVKRGRTIGFPTANLADVPTLVPGLGVYAGQVKVNGDSKLWPAAANIGPNPTFAEDERKIEIHLIGFSGDLYGQTIEMEFIDRLRSTQPFSGIEALKQQLAQDIQRAKEIVSECS
jgi:riboflavin kinase / FMN adenylyltransferase